MSEDVCEVYSVDNDRVECIETLMLDDELIHRLSDIFRALGDGTRLRILYALSIETLCVCELSRVLGLSLSAVSHQLRILRDLRLVKAVRRGKMMYYSLADEHIIRLLEMSVSHARER
jgi:ArsR family transcriptional regulator